MADPPPEPEDRPPETCRDCGAALPVESRAPLCPKCLLGLALEPEVAPGVGRMVGDYLLEELVARGGMGVVYRARQQSLNRTVALKMIVGGELASRESVRRFRVEAEAAANLHHPNIVPVYEVGEDEGLPYFTMRYVEGSNLAAMMGSFVPPAGAGLATAAKAQRAAAAFLAQVARTIAHAHRHGVLHRDIKPTNILIDRSGEPQLADFGLAKRLDREDAAVTLSSSALGSPSYMAPEQATGESTVASDVWSLGAVLYEMLTGRPPFLGKSAMETLRRAINEAPAAPRKLNPGLSKDLENVCLKCLEKDPGDRYSSADEFADDLERFVRGEFVLARPVPPAALFWRWCLRNPVPPLLGAALLLALAAGVVGIASQGQRTREANLLLSETVERLEWRQIRALEEKDRGALALAELARFLRHDASQWQAASYALSLLEERNFPLPLAEAFAHPELGLLRDLCHDDAGSFIASHEGGTAISIRDGWSGEIVRTVEAGSPVTALALSADATRLAVGEEGGRVSLVETATGETSAVLAELANPPGHLRFGDAGRFLAVAAGSEVFVLGLDSAASASDLAETGPRLTLGAPVEHLDACAEQRVLAVAADSQVGVFDFSGRMALQLFDFDGPIQAICPASDGKRLHVLSGNRVETVEVSTGARLAPITAERSDYIRDLALGNDGVHLFVGTGFGRVERWHATERARLQRIRCHLFTISAVGLSWERDLLVTGSIDGTARVWRASTLLPLSEPMPHGNFVSEARFLGNTERILSVERSLDRKHRYYLWKLRFREQSRPVLQPHGQLIGGVAMSPDDKWLAVEGVELSITLHAAATMERVSAVLPQEVTHGIFFTADSRSLLLVSREGRISKWSVPGLEPEMAPVEVGFNVLPSALSPDEQLLAVGGPSGRFAVYDTRDWELQWEAAHGAFVSSVSFSPDGRHLLTTSNDFTAAVRDARTGELACVYEGHLEKVIHGTFSPDGRWVVTGSYDGTAQVWESLTGKALLAPLRHRHQVTFVAIDDEGRRVASASREGVVQVWDAATGAPAFPPMIENASIRNVHFLKDRKRILTLSHDGIRLWDSHTGEPVTTLRKQGPVEGIGMVSDSAVALSSNEDRYLVGVNSSEVVLWDVSPPPPVAPSWFPDLLEAIAMQRVSVDGSLEALGPDETLRMLGRLRALPEDDEYARRVRESLGLSSEGASE